MMNGGKLADSYRTMLGSGPLHPAVMADSPFIVGAATQAPAPAPVAPPHPGSPEASAMIDSELAAHNWPTNTKNAARAGYVACSKLMGAAPVQCAAVGDAPEPITESEAIKLWHSDATAHRSESAFEWFSAGLIAAQNHYGILKGKA